jgi:glycosyltransferase involved in cell wall biosynthesis
VAYCSLQGAEPGVDPEFGIEVAWDIPLLEGYRWVHPANRSFRPGLGKFFGLLNPELWRLVRKHRYDVVVCFGYRAASFWIAAAGAKVSGAALVFTTDAHSFVSRNGHRWKARVKQIALPRILGLADGVLAPSSRTVEFLGRLGLNLDRVFLTPYVVDTSFFASTSMSADRAAVRRGWGVPVEACVALFCGKLVPWKRPADLLEAAVDIEPLHVVYAGDGSSRAALETLARNLGILPRVRFLGFVNQRQLPEVYAAADVLVLPSAHEPFGLVVNEAFACGLPAVVSEACGAAGDLVKDRETGFVVPVGDRAALADGLRTLAAAAELRRLMGEKARARVSEWGPEQNAEAFARACLEIASRRSAGR